MKLEDLSKHLSVVSGAVIIASVLFAAGYFSNFGILWLTALTVQDVLALAWVVLPGVVAAGVAGILIPQMYSIHIEGSRKGPSRFVDRPNVRNFLTGMAGSGGIMLLATMVMGYQYWHLATLGFIILSVSLFFVVKLTPPERIVRVAYLMIIFVPSSLAYVEGVVISASMIAQKPADSIRLADGGAITCTTLVYLGQRGVIHYQSDTVALVPWPEVRSVKKGDGCAKQSAPPQPQ